MRGGDEQQEVPEDPDAAGSPNDPCIAPETRLEWNADAAAAEALSEFYAKAEELQDDGLYEREFGAMVYGDEFGNVWLGPITPGPKMAGTVVIDDTGITPGTLLGFIHTHPSPQTEPSAGDGNLFNQYYEYVGGESGRGNLLRMYVVSRDNSEEPNSPFRIRIYTNDSDQSSDSPGPEVNPEGQPCP